MSVLSPIKGPCSYTLVESDKRVVKSLKNIAQSAQENGVGIRLMRTEPLDHRFDQLLFQRDRRGLHYVADWSQKISDTIVISNTPFWATGSLCNKLCNEVFEREGIFRAGRVPIIMNCHLNVGVGILGRTTRLGKIIDNYFTTKVMRTLYFNNFLYHNLKFQCYFFKELATINGQFYVPKTMEDSVWILLRPRKTPHVNAPMEDVQDLVNIFFSWRHNVWSKDAQLAPRFAQRLHYLQEKYK